MSMGLCVSPGFIPTPKELAELNPAFLRSILYSLEDAKTLKATGLPLIITLNNQCREVGGNWVGWNPTVLTLCEMFKDIKQLLVIGAGNEFDLYWKDNLNDVDPEFGADLARRTARIAHNYGIKASATSVAGPRWPEYLQVMADLCRNDVDYFDLHPYGQRPSGWKAGQQWMHGDLFDVMQQAINIAQKPIICTEYGVKIQDAGNEQEVANFLLSANSTLAEIITPYASWFAYTDLVGAPSEQGPSAFGLKSADGRKRPSWHAFIEVNEDVVIVPPTPKSVPVPNLDKWKNSVGKGLLEMMLEDNTEPSMASEWRPFNRGPSVPASIEQCVGLNGVTYMWLLETNKGYRLRPS